MQQEEKGRNKRVNFNFEKIFNNQEILNLIESLGIAEATFLQAKILPEIMNGKDYIIKGDSLSGKTLMCGLLLAYDKIVNDNFNALIVTSDDSKDRICEEFSKLNLFDNGDGNYNFDVMTIDEFKNDSSKLQGLNTLIFDNIEETEENINFVTESIKTVKESNKDAQVLLCSREISHEFEKAFKDAKAQISNENAAKEEISETQHYFCMLGAELTAKPNALCDILETEGRPQTIIFCNQPSDTDMVEAVLNKNGLKTAKLIGNAYYSRVMNALNDLEKGYIQAIIATDIGARQINVRNLELVINYSTPESCDTYLSRIGKTNEGGYLKKVINFIHPLDLINFHQIRKGLDFDIVEMEIPTASEVCEARFDNFVKEINENDSFASNEKLDIYYDLLNASSKKEDIIKYMIYNSLIKVSDSSNYAHRRKEKFDSKSFSEKDFASNTSEHEETPSSHHKHEPQIKDIRFYIGYGEDDDFNENTFINILNEYASEYSDKIKRFSLRKLYSFVDFSEEIADSIEGILKDALYNGNSLFFKRATTINVPREDDASDDSQLESENDNDNEEFDDVDEEDNQEIKNQDNI